MSEWREQIVHRFVPNVARVTAVSDPDGLLRDPGVFQAIQAKGFSILQFEDSVSFRFDYESRFRSKWDAGEEMELVVVFKPAEHDFETLPADVLANAHRLSFTLKDIFPRLSYSIVSQLETVYFDALYDAHQQYASQAHDETQTRGFILRHVFGIEPSVIKNASDLLRMLFQRHYKKSNIPLILDEYLEACLRQIRDFQSWPLDLILRNRAAFWEFLDERWPRFVRQSGRLAGYVEDEAPGLKYSGPELLPFDHDDIRIYIDNLFKDGLLTPVEWDGNETIDRAWMKVGLLVSDADNARIRFEELQEDLSDACPQGNTAAQDWLAFAFRYGQALALWTQLSPASRSKYQNHFSEVRSFVNQQFVTWLQNNYGGLFNYPASSPLMVHHIPGFITHQISSKLCQRAAFILIDGLSIDQWLIIKDTLKGQGSKSSMEENSLFAWIPTVTCVSRQAAFSGRIPRYFAETINRTDRDEAAWRQFWTDRGLSPAETGFVAINGDTVDRKTINDLLTTQTRVFGLTIYKIDKIMHGMQLGAVGMSSQLRTWTEEGFLVDVLNLFRSHGFDVFISADHGNIEAVGIGRPREGVLSETRGERCRIYPDAILRKGCLAAFPNSFPWDNVGLPDSFNSVLAPYGEAFIQKDATLVCHGGAALEEVCVPFIRIHGQDLKTLGYAQQN
jgi:PglZ domain